MLEETFLIIDRLKQDQRVKEGKKLLLEAIQCYQCSPLSVCPLNVD